jgi:hypothetical protein
MAFEKSFILVGGPDSGKSNFLARLWLALQSKRYSLISSVPPDDLDYIEGIAAHLLTGKFVPRTEPEDRPRNFQVTVEAPQQELKAEIVVPDLLGEIWKKAVSTLEVPEPWFNALRRANGAIIFVRVLSDNNIQPLDWVASQAFLRAGLGNDNDSEVPTQVVLIELLRFIAENISKSDGKPRVAIIVTAWDLLHEEEAAEGPTAYLSNQFPMFAGRIKDADDLDIRVFGSSIVGGDLDVPEFMQKFLQGDIGDAGYIVIDKRGDSEQELLDITEPLKWLIGQ